MKRVLLCTLVVCLALTACGGQATPDPAEVARLVDQAVKATVAAMPTPTPTPAAKALSPEIEKLVFEESRFAEPIWGCFSEYYKVTGLDRATIAREPRGPLAFFLVENGYAQFKFEPEGQYTPAFYRLDCNKTIDPYLLSGTCTPGHDFCPLLARRKLKEVGFTNEYEQAGYRFYAVNFSYTLASTLPGLPDFQEEFTGKVVLRWDASEGIWQQYGSTIGDRGEREYISLLEDLL